MIFPNSRIICIRVSYFFLALAKWSKYTHTHTHTHTERASGKRLFLHKARSVKSTPHSPPLFHHVNAAQKYQFSNYCGSIYWHLCVPLFHFSVSWSSKMRLGVLHLETWDSTQPCIALPTLEFRSCFFVFGRIHTAPNSLTLHKPLSVVSCVKTF